MQLVLATALAVVLGLSAGTERYILIGVLLGGAAVMLSALNWRRHLIPMIFAYVCVEGFVSLLFRQYRVSLLLKDFLIIIAYVSFLAEIVSTKKFVFFRGILVPMAVLVLLGIAEIFNPGLPNVLVGVVGFKILCFYMPLVFLGYYCFRTLEESRRFILFLLVLAIPVGLVAAWQYAIGPAAMTQFGGAFEIAVVRTPGSAYGSHLRAIGTFASPGMLSWFAFCMVALAIAFLGTSTSRRDKYVGMIGLFAVVISLLASGTRGGLLTTAAVTIAIFVLLGKRKQLVVGLALGAAAVLMLALVSKGIVGRLESLLHPEVYVTRLAMAISGTARGLSKAPLGFGLGYASVGARHVMPGGQPIMMAENYATKLAYEMGWFGLTAFLWLVGASFSQGLRCYRQCTSPESRWVVGCLAIFLAGLLSITLVAGTGLDKIPGNVFFWFFLGVMLKVPDMQVDSRAGNIAGPPGNLQAPPGFRPAR